MHTNGVISTQSDHSHAITEFLRFCFVGHDSGSTLRELLHCFELVEWSIGDIATVDYGGPFLEGVCLVIHAIDTKLE